MIRTWKVTALAALTAASIASPALAQSSWGPTGYSVYRHSSGYGAFAMVPHGGRYSSAANGGGSPGYNWAVENDH
jgi:hypothetical protein